MEKGFLLEKIEVTALKTRIKGGAKCENFAPSQSEIHREGCTWQNYTPKCLQADL
jgi:hypothetical protein